MGLDLTHDKACLNKTDKMVSAETFRDREVSLDWFSSYLQQIETTTVCEEIVLITHRLHKHLHALLTKAHLGKSPLNLDKYPSRYTNINSHITYTYLAEDQDLDAEMALVEAANLERFAQNKSAMIKLKTQLIEVPSQGRYGILSFGKQESFQGFYFERVAEQRNGMSGSFWNVLGDNGYIFHKARILLALEHAVSDPEEHFKRHFVDNFEEGCSIVSWAG